FGPHEVAVVVDPSQEMVGIELTQEEHASVVAVVPPGVQERLERALLGDGQIVAVLVGELELDVEVADRTQPGRGLAQAASIAPGPVGAEGLTEDPPGRTLPARRDA